MSYHADPACPSTCAHCGERVKRTNGFFRSWPVAVALHHDCVAPYHRKEK